VADPPALFAHQAQVLESTWDRENHALFMEMGTGKTAVALHTFRRLLEAGSVNDMLVVAPKGVVGNWVDREIPTHLGLGDRCAVHLWHSGAGKNERTARRFFMDPPGSLTGPRILVVNVEALSSVAEARELCAAFLRQRRALMVVDESTSVKSPSARRTKVVLALSDAAAFRRILTGSPVTRAPLDLYTQMRFLDWRILGHSNFYSFRARYAVLRDQAIGGRTVKLVVGYQRLAELADKIRPHATRILKEECLDLPPKVYTRRALVLSDEQKRVYKGMRETAQAELVGGNWASATAAITQLMRLQQVAAGFITDETGGLHSLPHNRIAALLETVAETEGRVVVWSHWRHCLREIEEALAREYGRGAVRVIHGGIDQSEREQAITDFQNPESPLRFLVANPAVAGWGVTLTAASTVVYYTNSYDLEHRLQSEDRCHRIGQTRSVTYVDLVAEATVDERVIAALRAKIDIAAQIVRDGPSGWID
jgi:SNF2 family DNA or RNA helicase